MVSFSPSIFQRNNYASTKPNHSSPNSRMPASKDVFQKQVASATPKFQGNGNANSQLLNLLDQYNPSLIELERCLGAGASTRIENDKGQKPLHMAVQKIPSDNLPQAIKLLLDKGADINARDASGKTPLMQAAESKGSEIISLLISKGARVNDQDNKGKTPLMHTMPDNVRVDEADSLIKTEELIHTLLRHGARKNIRDKEGKTAADHANQKADRHYKDFYFGYTSAAIMECPEWLEWETNRVDGVIDKYKKLAKLME